MRVIGITLHGLRICLHVQGWLAFFDYQRFLNETLEFVSALFSVTKKDFGFNILCSSCMCFPIEEFKELCSATYHYRSHYRIVVEVMFKSV